MGHEIGRRWAVCAALVLSLLTTATRAETFTIGVIPDTQYYTVVPGGEAMLRREMQYLVDQRIAQNIVFTVHLGDVWDHGDSRAEVEVPIATRAMQILADAGMRFCVVPGNHDYDNADRRTRGVPLDGSVVWAQAFGPRTSFFSNKDWYIGSNKAGTNSCQIFAAGQRRFLHIGLALEPSQADMQFARKMMAAHPDLPTILTTHEYLGWDSGPGGEASRLDDGYRGKLDHTSGHELWQQLISQEPQIFMVLCGHSADGPHVCANRRTDPNNFGEPVHQLLSNYQFVGDPASGGGWIRLMKFDTATNTVHLRTYSTELGMYSNDPTLTDGSEQARLKAPFNYRPNGPLLPEDDPRSSDFKLRLDFGEEALARFRAKPKTRGKA